MNSVVKSAMAAACMLLSAAIASSDGLSIDTGAPTRDFEFTYVAKLSSLPGGARLSRVWIPLPQTDGYQTIDHLRIETALRYSTRRDPDYGNEYLYLEIPAVAKSPEPAEVRVTFHATRREHRVILNERAPDSHAPAEAVLLDRCLQPDRLVPLQGTIAELSGQVTHGIQDPLAKARAIYDYVVATMRYDKSGTGWGNGDAVWACTSKRGNCTDFHSLLIGMLRAAHIPARFEIGFPLPGDHVGTIPGYHCWAEFYVEPYGWIPVDASEAWKHPERRDYYFGANDENRVQFTIGRDLRLERQQGDPLNYFIYPYAEVDGKPFQLSSEFSFRDLLPPQTEQSTKM